MLTKRKYIHMELNKIPKKIKYQSYQLRKLQKQKKQCKLYLQGQKQ